MSLAGGKALQGACAPAGLTTEHKKGRTILDATSVNYVILNYFCGKRPYIWPSIMSVTCWKSSGLLPNLILSASTISKLAL